LFGARGTGKSTLLEKTFSQDEALVVDLLKPEFLAPLQANPDELERILSGSNKPWCVIDEVQKIPALLELFILRSKARELNLR
jgi:predicted AAA+ superfamily ATPase